MSNFPQWPDQRVFIQDEAEQAYLKVSSFWARRAFSAESLGLWPNPGSGPESGVLALLQDLSSSREEPGVFAGALSSLDDVHRALSVSALEDSVEPFPHASVPSWPLGGAARLGRSLGNLRSVALKALSGLPKAGVIRPRGRFSTSRPLASGSPLHELTLRDRVQLLKNLAVWCGAFQSLAEFYAVFPRVIAHGLHPGRGRSCLPSLKKISLSDGGLPLEALSLGAGSFLCPPAEVRGSQGSQDGSEEEAGVDLGVPPSEEASRADRVLAGTRIDLSSGEHLKALEAFLCP